MIRNQLSACLAMILFASAGIAALAPRTAQSAQAETGAESVADIEGLQLWLDAASVLAEDGEKLSVWENKAQSVLEGAGDAVQSEEARQPVYVAQSEALGGPAVRLSANTFFRVGGTQGFYLDDMTIIVVAAVDYDGNGTKEMISRISGAPTFNHNWFFNCENGLFNYGWGSSQGTGVAYHQARVPFESGRANVFAGRKSGSTGYTAVNGEILGTFAGTSPEDEKRPVYLGSDSGNTVDGDFGEVLIFNRGLSDAEMEKVYRYLYEKWDFERLDGSVLDDITVGGEQISGFSPYRYEYDVIVSGDAQPEFAAEARYAGATVEKTVGNDAVVFRVTNEACVGTREYRINLRSLDAVENRYTRAGIGEVELNDGFWKDTLTQYVTRTAGYVYDMFDYSYSFDNFDRVAAGERKVLGNTSQHAGEILIPSGDNRLIGSKDGEWSWGNEPWREGLIYEEIRAVADIVSLYSGDPALGEAAAELKARTEGYVDRIYAAALTTTGEDRNGRRIDGYFSTFALLTQTGVIDETESGHIWTHDLYNYGCLVEAGISWYRATGDMRLLFATTRFTEFLLDYMYGEDGYAVVPSHQIAEEALLDLYDLYKNDPELVRRMEETFDSAEGLDAADRYYRLEIRWEQYIDIVRDWIEKRGVYDGRYQSISYGDYAQDHATFDKQTTAAGHSVRANLWYSAIAAAGNYLDDREYISAANTIWNDIVGKQMYITGGTGSVHGSESYGGDYHLPHDGYCETCASVGMAFFAGNMSELFGQAEYADVLCQAPLDPNIWKRVDEFGDEVSQYYWENISVYRLDDELVQYWDFFLSQLLKYNRPFSAARVIEYSEYSNSTMIVSILHKCCEFQNYTEPTGASIKDLSEHGIRHLFKKLYADQNVELNTLVQLEIAYMPYLKHEWIPNGINRYLSNNPIEFVELIAYNYKPDPGFEFLAKEHPDNQRSIAYDIIELFKTVPGFDGKSISEDKFNAWVTTAQEHAKKIGYTNSFAFCFGRVLSYAPVGIDGIFPHEVIRDYFEHSHSEKLENGLITELHNQRGFHVVTGGLEEKEISDKYRVNASKIRISYPRSAALLDKIAQSYMQESLYEQKRELLDFTG